MNRGFIIEGFKWTGKVFFCVSGQDFHPLSHEGKFVILGPFFHLAIGNPIRLVELDELHHFEVIAHRFVPNIRLEPVDKGTAHFEVFA